MTDRPKTHLTFGTRRGTLDEVSQSLIDAFATPFKLRESSYLGGLYYLARPATPHAASLKLYSNTDIVDGGAIRRDWPEHALILEAEDVKDAATLSDLLGEMGFVPFT